MTQPVCFCGHEKRDHVTKYATSSGMASCKVCLCERYARQAKDVKPVATRSVLRQSKPTDV